MKKLLNTAFVTVKVLEHFGNIFCLRTNIDFFLNCESIVLKVPHKIANNIGKGHFWVKIRKQGLKR